MSVFMRLVYHGGFRASGGALRGRRKGTPGPVHRRRSLSRGNGVDRNGTRLKAIPITPTSANRLRARKTRVRNLRPLEKKLQRPDERNWSRRRSPRQETDGSLLLVVPLA